MSLKKAFGKAIRSRSSSRGRLKHRSYSDDNLSLYDLTMKQLDERAEELRHRGTAESAPDYSPLIRFERDKDGDQILILYHAGERCEVMCDSYGPVHIKKYGTETSEIPTVIKDEIMRRAEDRWVNTIMKSTEGKKIINNLRKEEEVVEETGSGHYTIIEQPKIRKVHNEVQMVGYQYTILKNKNLCI